MSVTKVTSKDWLKYAMALAGFGYDENVELDCINKAYRDFNRTLRFGKLSKEKRQQLRDTASNVLLSSLQELKKMTNVNQIKFDDWHKKTCSDIKQIYKSITFSDGQAQKWVNMALKYIYMMNNINEGSLLQKNYRTLYQYCHIPLDRIILDAFWIKYDIDYTDGVCWSGLNYKQYMQYQKKGREIAEKSNLAPLDVEFDLFMN